MRIDQEKIVQLYKEAMTQVYSDEVLDHGQNPRNLGAIPNSNAFGIVFGPCGDTMAIWLEIDNNNNIKEIGFTTDGCLTSLAAGSMVTELARGKNTNEARQINQQEILKALGGLPEGSEHCALLAANTLKEAISDHMTPSTHPKRTLYKFA